MFFVISIRKDYKKIIPNGRHDLILTRARTDDNSLIAEEDEKAKINLLKKQWKIPHITLSDTYKLKLYKHINNGQTMKLAFRNWDLYEYLALPSVSHHIWNVKTTSQMEKPRYIILALQTNKRNLLKGKEFTRAK